MNRRQAARLRHLKAQATCTHSWETLTHDQLTARGRELGLPAFCNGWPHETLNRKIREIENGKS